MNKHREGVKETREWVLEIFSQPDNMSTRLTFSDFRISAAAR